MFIYTVLRKHSFLNQKFVLVALGCGGSTSYNISYLVQGATTNLPGQYFLKFLLAKLLFLIVNLNKYYSK